MDSSNLLWRGTNSTSDPEELGQSFISTSKPTYGQRQSTNNIIHEAPVSPPDDKPCSSSSSNPNENWQQKQQCHNSPTSANGSLPLPDGMNYFMTISCGNTSNSWVFHDTNKMKSICSWSTPHISEQDLHEITLQDLIRFIPTKVQTSIFGKENTQTLHVEKAKELIQSNIGADKLLIYIISTNPTQTNRLNNLFSIIPTQTYLLSAKDFYHPNMNDTTWYESIGVDRVANMCGAASLYGFPAFVIDGGTAITYTATDMYGNIIGGAIAPGVVMKLNTLHESTGALPRISIEEMNTSIEKALKAGKGLPLFSTSTKDGIVTNILMELASSARSYIQGWIDKVGESSLKRKRDSLTLMPTNTTRVVVVTGGSKETIARLLETDYGGVIETSTSNNISSFICSREDNLAHIGIQTLIRSHLEDRNETQVSPNFLLNRDMPHKYVGKRVAKYFHHEGESRGSIYYGSVTEEYSLKSGEYMWKIKYDDDDDEYYKREDLMRAIGMFKSDSEIKSEKLATLEVDDHMPYYFLGHQVSKPLQRDEIVNGSITDYKVGNQGYFWHIVYDNGEKETLYKHDMKKGLELYQSNEAKKEELT